MAQLLKASIRSIDTPARYGGEEFAVILPRTSSEGLLKLPKGCAGRWRAVASNAFNSTYALTLSVGIASYPKDGDSPEELITKADLAMYEAKASGKNVVRNYIDRATAKGQGKDTL